MKYVFFWKILLINIKQEIVEVCSSILDRWSGGHRTEIVFSRVINVSSDNYFTSNGVISVLSANYFTSNGVISVLSANYFTSSGVISVKSVNYHPSSGVISVKSVNYHLSNGQIERLSLHQNAHSLRWPLLQRRVPKMLLQTSISKIRSLLL